MLKIGITGGIGSGKTTVCRMFRALGVPVYDADTRARWLMENNPALRNALVTTFGADVFEVNGRLDRPHLAAAVFGNPTALAQLNGLVHPAVGADFATWAAARAADGATYVLKEAALMFESDSWRQLDGVIAVTAPAAMRQARVLHRDPHRTAQQIQDIMAQQLPEAEKIARAQHVLYNDGQELLIPQILALHARFSGTTPIPVKM